MNKDFNVVAAQVVLPEPDRIVANLIRFVGLDKDTARKCQEVMRCTLLARVSAPAQAASGELIESVDAWFAKKHRTRRVLRQRCGGACSDLRRSPGAGRRAGCSTNTTSAGAQASDG